MKRRRACPANAQQPLRTLRLADRHREHAADPKLRQQRRGQSHAPCRHHDGVEWRGLGAANGGRALQHGHVAASELAQTLFSRAGARGAPFDGDHQSHHAAQHGGQVSRARADLQHAVARLQLAGLQKHRHRKSGQHLHRGIERQRHIMPREFAVTLRNERLAWHLAQRLQQHRITHAARDHLLSNHSLLCAINCVHRMLLPAGVTAVRVVLRGERRRSWRATPRTLHPRSASLAHNRAHPCCRQSSRRATPRLHTLAPPSHQRGAHRGTDCVATKSSTNRREHCARMRTRTRAHQLQQRTRTTRFDPRNREMPLHTACNTP